MDDSGDERGEATGAFEHLQKKVRVTSSTNDDGTEITLKLPKSSGTTDDDELQALLWGSTTNNSDDEADAKKKRPSSINRNKRTLRAEGRKDDGSGALASTATDQSTSNSSDGLWGLSMQPSSSKKTHQESRELDKIEAVILQANQMKRQLEDPRTFQQITVVKARAMLDKIDGKKTEEVSRMVLDMIRNEGNGCRASQVWDSLRDAKSLAEGIVEFTEALQDQEASTDTLRACALRIKDLGVSLPRSVNMVMCRRSVEKLINQEKFGEIFKFLDPSCSKEVPLGIATVLPEGEEKEKLDALIMDVQGGSISHCINQILLREFTSE